MLAKSFNRMLFLGRSLVFSYPTVHTQQSTVPPGVAEHARGGSFCPLLGQRRGLQLANPGQDVAPIGAARQEDNFLELQIQLGSLQYLLNARKGASEHLPFLSLVARTFDDTVRNINIERVGYLRTSFIAFFPTEDLFIHLMACASMTASVA